MNRKGSDGAMTEFETDKLTLLRPVARLRVTVLAKNLPSRLLPKASPARSMESRLRRDLCFMPAAPLFPGRGNAEDFFLSSIPWRKGKVGEITKAIDYPETSQ